jgi:large subunit ribosomal protein L10
MNKTQKAEAVEALGQGLAQSSNAILFGFAGLKVPEVTELRRQVRGTDSEYLVVKNTLALRATKGTVLEAVAEHFVGPTAVAYNKSNAVALAKVLTAFAKANPNLVFKAGVIDGRAISAAEIKTIAELPSREELVARLLFLMQSPLRRLVTVLNGPVRNLAGVMSQIAEQKSKSGPAPTSAEPGN